jgi:hypothetical protein
MRVKQGAKKKTRDLLLRDRKFCSDTMLAAEAVALARATWR